MLTYGGVGGGTYGGAGSVITGTFSGTGALTGTTSTGIPVLLAQSFVAVSAPADTTEDTLATITIPANTMGSNGALRLAVMTSYTNNANGKTLKVYFGGTGGSNIGNFAEANVASRTANFIIGNRNATNSQVSRFTGGSSVSANTFSSTSAIDTTASTTIVITGQKTTAGDTFTLDGYILEYMKASNA